MPQSYQEVTIEVMKELINIEKNQDYQIRFTSLCQDYFYILKKQNPSRFERLIYDENGSPAFSKDLSFIIRDLRLAGIIRADNKINIENLNSELKSLEEKVN